MARHAQALDAQRAPAFSFDPATELTLITDPKHPLYDARVNLPVERSMVLDVAARGVFQPIGVRRVGEESVVLFGRQRVKAAIVANALGAGARFPEGKSVPTSVGVAIAEMSQDIELAERIKGLMAGKPIRVPAVARNAGDDSAARMMMKAENAHRRGDATVERIRAAQMAVEKHGDSVADIAQAENVDPKTVARWLKMDVSGGAKKPRRTKAKGPGKVQINKWLANKKLGDDYRVLFGFLVGVNTREEALHMNPDLKDII